MIQLCGFTVKLWNWRLSHLFWLNHVNLLHPKTILWDEFGTSKRCHLWCRLSCHGHQEGLRQGPCCATGNRKVGCLSLVGDCWWLRDVKRNDCDFQLYLSIFCCCNWLPGWWFGTCFLFFHIFWIIIPVDFHIFQRGWKNQPVLLL